MELIILYLTAALAVSFLCSILEAVLLSTPATFIAAREKEGAKHAQLLRRLKLHVDKPISAILSLNTVAHTVGAAGVGAEAVKVFGEAYFGIISAVLTILILVLSEIIPKTVGAGYWRQLALPSAPVIRAMIVITYPLVVLSELITRLLSPKRPPLSVSREEVSAMVSVGTQEGVFQTQENKIIQNLIRLDNIPVREIMTPRTVAVTAPERLSLREFYTNRLFRIYSRIPVYGTIPTSSPAACSSKPYSRSWLKTNSTCAFRTSGVRSWPAPGKPRRQPFGSRCSSTRSTSRRFTTNTVVSRAS